MDWNHLPEFRFDCFTRRPDLVLLPFQCRHSEISVLKPRPMDSLRHIGLRYPMDSPSSAFHLPQRDLSFTKKAYILPAFALRIYTGISSGFRH